MSEWIAAETSTHQDHVIAHVIGATALGYLVLDETLHLLLDIGFVWTIYLDGQMVLLPRSAAISELEVDAEVRQEISREADLLERGDIEGLRHFVPAPVECLIKEVEFFAADERRKLVLVGESDDLVIETSLKEASIEISG
ncbi:MAG TPA: hypothetical protein VN643_02720 [Pyrinomonadaceae bacterium]|nr:hypothetical protein [Pyrinomonadaceae bacterium]